MNPFKTAALCSLGCLVALFSAGPARADDPSPYCLPTTTNCPNTIGTGSTAELIKRVQFNTLDFSTNALTGYPHADCYYNIPAASATTAVDPNSAYTFTIDYENAASTVFIFTTNNDQGVAWIDFNRNNTFDTGESVTLSRTNYTADGMPATLTGTITVPINASPGLTRVRVRILKGTTAPTACGATAGTSGTTQDFTITINPPVVGACCQGTTCTIDGSASCTSGGGTYYSGTPCTPTNICGIACCTASGDCSFLTAADCSSSGGTPSGSAGSTCQPVNPCGGSCCDYATGSCTPVTAAASSGCTSSGKIYTAGALCSAVPTPCAYCVASGQNCGGPNGNQKITLVTFNELYNNTGRSDGGAPNGPCYFDYTLSGSPTTVVVKGQTYTLSVYDANTGANNVVYYVATATNKTSAWLDWNQNFLFTDSGESVVMNTTDGFLYTFDITIPATAAVGNTRLRIRHMGTQTAVPCGLINSGETEDYTITVVASGTQGSCCGAGGACTITPTGSCPSAPTGFMVDKLCDPTNPCGGACCDAFGSCTTVASAALCATPNKFVSGGACSTNACVGTCCDGLNGYCTLASGGEGGGCLCGTTWGGYGSTCSATPCPRGACCIESTGACITSTIVGCTPDRGRYKGDGTTCTTPCAPLGACCTTAGACTVSTDQQNCANGNIFSPGGVCTPAASNPCFFGACCSAGGVCTRILVGQSTNCTGTSKYLGDGTLCTPLTPNAICTTVRACCNSTSGLCTTVFNAAACPLDNIALPFGSSCLATNSCLGACCNLVTGACTSSGTTGCTAGTMNFLGVGTTCSTTSPCGGACCNLATGACTTFTAVAGGCVSGTSAYQGDGSTCTSNPCSGACCNNTTRACTAVVGTACPVGSTFVNAAWCSPDACTAGSCCDITTGSCTTKTAAGCTGTTAFTTGACVASPCVGACCDVTGTCTMTTSAVNCGTTTGTYQGVGSVCTGSTCGLGACCKPDGTCASLDSDACSAAGTYLGAGSVCPAGLCYGEIQTVAHVNQPDISAAITLNPGDRLVGSSNTGLDRYWIKPPAQPLGFIYRHTLTRTSARQNQVLQFKARAQFDGVGFATPINNIAVSVNTGPGLPLHQISWYGFGRSEPADVAVMNVAPLSVYTLTLTTEVVTPIVIGDTTRAGYVTFSTVGETLTDTDFWVYDSNLNPLPGFGNDDIEDLSKHSRLQSELARELTPGDYYLGITDNNFANSKTTPVGDRNPNKLYFDYSALPGQPDLVVGQNNSSGTPVLAPADVSFKITDGNNTTRHYTAVRDKAFGVVWAKLTISPATVTGACCKVDGTCAPLSAFSCSVISGTYGGDGVACGVCSPPTGACCQYDGTCTVTIAVSCTTYSGAYVPGTACSAIACPKVVITGDLATAAFSQSNLGVGEFVDVTAPPDRPLLVTRFDYYQSLSFLTVTQYPLIDVYVHGAGTYRGNENSSCLGAVNPNGWEYNTQVTSNVPRGGEFTPIPVVLAKPVVIPAGQTVGFYLLGRWGGMARNTSGPTSFTDGVATVASDEGRTSFVNTTGFWSVQPAASQFTFTGRVFYNEAVTCCRGTTCISNVPAPACVDQPGIHAVILSACDPAHVSPAACCYADFNHSGTASIDDLFIYINVWLTGSPFTKINGNGTGTPSIDDLFIFINLWLTGCT